MLFQTLSFEKSMIDISEAVMDKFDLIVIGAGPGGYVAAIRGAQKGLNVAVIEADRVGGTCLNRGCIPTKAMIHASSLYREMQEGERFGLHAEGVSYDYSKICDYKQETVDTLVGGVQQLLKGNKVTVIEGRGVLQKPENGVNAVRVGDDVYYADNIILAAGSKPASLPVEGADLPKVINSDGLFALDHAPENLVIIGGGVIGVEFATVFSNLGSKITILEALPKILDNFDKEISQNLKMILKKRGVDIHTSAMVSRFEEGADGSVTAVYEEKGKEQTASGDYILVAAGRRPVTEGLFAEDAQPEMNGRYVKVDDDFRTSIPGVYAIGDLIGGIQLAHAASAHGIRAVENICGSADSQNVIIVPAGVYTDPEIATVGMTEAQAKEQGIEVITGKFIMSANGKSLITKEERGFIKVVAESGTEKILGAQMMCARATDMIGEFTTAIVNHLTVSDMLRSIMSHPTYSEGIGEALEDVHGMSLHTAPRPSRR